MSGPCGTCAQVLGDARSTVLRLMATRGMALGGIDIIVSEIEKNNGQPFVVSENWLRQAIELLRSEGYRE